MTPSFITSTAAALTAEGFTFYGEGNQFFGDARAKVRLYRRRGPRMPATVARMFEQQRQTGEIETWWLLRWKDMGDTIVAVRVE